jgi:Fe2+ or Zn2+ uptake regulation protein
MIIIIIKDANMSEAIFDYHLENWKAALNRSGYRVTKPRMQVMGILIGSDTPLTPQEIYHRSLELDSPPGIASVYRTLDMLDNLGLIQQIHQPGGCHAICPAFEGHQHMLICNRCGKMRVVECNKRMSEYINRIEEETGYQIDEHWLQLFGLCQQCS